MNKSKNRYKIKNFSSKCFSCHLKLDSDISSQKTENLNIYKSSFQSLLFKIKNSLIEILSNKEKSNINLKNILLELRDNLKNQLKDKNIEKQNLENEIYEKKTNLQNQLFNGTELVNNNNIDNNNLLSNNLDSEISSLKLLNFMAENLLNKIDILTLKKFNEYNYMKLCIQFKVMGDNEFILNKQNYCYHFVDKILHNQKNDIRKKFKICVLEKKSRMMKLKI